MIAALRTTEDGDIVLDNGGLIEWNRANEHFAPIESVRDVGLASLRRVWATQGQVTIPTGPPKRWDGRHRHDVGGGDSIEEMLLSTLDPDDFDVKYSTAENVSIILTPDGWLAVRIDVELSDDIAPVTIAQVIAPLLTRNRASLLEITEVGFGGGVIVWQVDIQYVVRARTVGDAYAFGVDVKALIEVLTGTGLTPEKVWRLLEGGQVDLLVGQPESIWLEVKSRPYDVDGEAAKIELAQDVARFANSEQGGIIIVGMATRRRAHGEIIAKVAPRPTAPNVTRRYHDTIDRRVFPPIDGLEVARMPTAKGDDIIVLRIPPQPEELKPFLVHGAIVGREVEGAFISIVRRRGEQSIPITGPAVHSMLVAGRALLRGDFDMVRKRPSKS